MAKKTLKISYLWVVLLMVSMPIHAERNYDSKPVTVLDLVKMKEQLLDLRLI